MNRSFRAHESQMQAVMKQSQQFGSLRSSMMKEKEEDLALFLEMRKREKERNNLFLQNSEEFDAPIGLKPGSSPIFNITSSTPARRTGADDFLNSENDKNDYEWLLTPPGTPLFPSLEMEQKTAMSQIGTPKARPTSLKSRLAHPQPVPATRSNLTSRQPVSSPGSTASSGGIRRPSSSGGPGSRPGTPTGRPTLTSASNSTSTMSSKPTLTTASKPAMSSVSKPSRSSTPTSRATLTSTKPTLTSSSRPTLTSASKPSRSSTPTPRATLTSTKSTVPPRSSTPQSRTTARSSTPTARPTVPASKPTSRAATPTRRPYDPPIKPPSTSITKSDPPIKPPSTSITKSGATTTRTPVPPRASSPTVKSRPWNPAEMPGFSLDAPPNLRTSLPERPISASRGRPGGPTARSSSVEANPNGRGRRQSCSPSRGRSPNGISHGSGSSVPAMNRLYSKANDNVSPVLIGTKMVERVINMRKLAPPKHDDKHSPRSNLSGKSSSPDSSGFGRTLSKKSLDMAIRHMDIRQRIPGNLRPLMTNIPASSMYSVRSGHTRSRTVSVSDSPLATSSNASSELSVNNNGLCVDHGSEVEDDINSEKCVRSPARIQGR